MLRAELPPDERDQACHRENRTEDDRFRGGPVFRVSAFEHVLEAAHARNEKAETDAKVQLAKAKVAEVQAKIQQGAFGPKQDGLAAAQGQQNNPIPLIDARARMMDAQTKAKELAVRMQEAQIEAQQRTADRQSKEQLERMNMAKDHMSDVMDLENERLAAQARVAPRGVET